jgi:hypothetical protein
MRIECSSNVFHTQQPCGYSRDYTDYEEEVNRDYQNYLKNVKRRNLSAQHPDWAPDGYYAINGPKFLEKCLVPAWMDVFTDRMKMRSADRYKIDVEMTGVSSPKYYNFETDAALFDIHIAAEDLEKIRQQVFEHKEIFEAYLQEYLKSYPGFFSFAPYQGLEKWEEYYASEPFPRPNEPPYHNHWELAVFCLLEFWLFAFDSNRSNEVPSFNKLDRNLDIGAKLEYRLDHYINEIDYKDYMDFNLWDSEIEECA